MEANELRLGNWIKEPIESGGKIGQVKRIETDKDGYSYYLDHCSPIPLTEEWLLKFNADKDREYYYLNPHPSITFFFNSLKDKFWIDVNGLDIKTNIKFVHELQNWYYCNSEKEELVINKYK